MFSTCTHNHIVRDPKKDISRSNFIGISLPNYKISVESPSRQGSSYLSQEGPYTDVVVAAALKYLYGDPFKAYVPTIWEHGVLGSNTQKHLQFTSFITCVSTLLMDKFLHYLKCARTMKVACAL